MTQALWRRMGFIELIVATPEQYVDTPVRIGTDQSERARVSARILETCPVLFENAAEVHCLEDWLWSLT